MDESGSGNPDEIRHQLGPYELTVATAFGPRVVGLKHGDSPEMFVTLEPEVSVSHPSGAKYRFRGGHRLWASPEDPAVTYAPDDHNCTVTSGTDSLTIAAPPDMAGFEKTIHLNWADSRLNVDHHLRWAGKEPIEASPWAITQLQTGGVAILPVVGVGKGPGADRSIVAWPYTSLNDERISWAENAALIHAMPGEPIKLGSGPDPGSVGYLRGGYLFTKRFSAPPGEYPDRGAIAQIYANGLFCELESVGPLVRFEPGEETRHFEVWEVTRCPDLESAVAAVTP